MKNRGCNLNNKRNQKLDTLRLLQIIAPLMDKSECLRFQTVSKSLRQKVRSNGSPKSM